MNSRVLSRSLEILFTNSSRGLSSKSTAHAPLLKLVEINDEHAALRRVVMSNERHRNSLGLEMIRSLQQAVDSTDPSKTRALVITSSSPTVYSSGKVKPVTWPFCESKYFHQKKKKNFNSGHNLKELTTETGADKHRQVFDEFTRLCLSLRNLPMPTIAEVHGLAAAGGFQLAASCDLIVASSKATFSTPGIKFGVFCSTPGVPLSRLVSSKIALKMLYTGEALSASEALAHGIISELVQVGENNAEESARLLAERVNRLARQIEANSGSIVTLGKRCFYEQIEQETIHGAYKVASQVMCENLQYQDCQSGLSAFAAKKKPTWSHSDKKVA
jgi:enoyl-CoA hydratase/carnithine racemase